MLKIGYSPYGGKQNDYVNNMKKIIACATGAKILPIPNTKDFIRNPLAYKRLQFDYCIVNWIDNDIVSKKNGKISCFGLIKFVSKITIIKFLSKKTIFVRHNNYPHHTENGLGAKVEKIIDFFEKFFTLTVTHSGHNETSHRVYIPHPLYSNEIDGKSYHTDEKYFLIFGRILRYKKIKEFIESAILDQKIIIAGPCSDLKYLEEIKIASKGKNIEILPEFLEEKDAKQLVVKSSGLILCHADANMVVSGSYFYAVSLGIPVFAKNTPFFNWLSSTRETVGLYNFNTFEELVVGLNQATKEIDYLSVKRFAQENFGDDIVKNYWIKNIK